MNADFKPGEVLADEEGETFWIAREDGDELTEEQAIAAISEWFRVNACLDEEEIAEQLPRVGEMGINAVWMRLNPDTEMLGEGYTHVRCEADAPGAIPFWMVTA